MSWVYTGGRGVAGVADAVCVRAAACPSDANRSVNSANKATASRRVIIMVRNYTAPRLRRWALIVRRHGLAAHAREVHLRHVHLRLDGDGPGLTAVRLTAASTTTSEPSTRRRPPASRGIPGAQCRPRRAMRDDPCTTARLATT